MNLFYLDNNIKQSCEALADVHLRKMPLESVQMLCSYVYLRLYSKTHPLISFRKNIDFKNQYKAMTGLYLPTHINHPVNIWIRQTDANTLYMLKYTEQLFRSYSARFKKEHGSYSVFKVCKDVIMGIINTNDTNFTPVSQCMPDNYKSTNPVEAYRQYYKSKKITSKIKLVWSSISEPDWIKS